MKYTHVFFDLDGTLTDSSPGITNAIIYARKKWGLPPGTNEDYYKFIGPPMPESYELFWGFTKEQSQRFLEDYREYFSAVGLYENSVYPGIPALLHSLTEAGCRLSMATTKPTGFSREIAEHFGFARYFDVISGSGPEAGNTKYAVIENARLACGVDMAHAIMVGDKFHDVEGAHLHGIPCIGVSYGFGGRQELENAGADFIADTVEQLGALLMP